MSDLIGMAAIECHQGLSEGDYIKVECNSNKGKSWLTGKIKEIKIYTQTTEHVSIKLDNSWHINDNDIVIEHEPIELKEDYVDEQIRENGQFGMGA